jgi:hypothetical protein
MMSLFKTYVGIDYSGAKTPTSRLKGLRVFKATRNSEPMKVKSPSRKKWNWTRSDRDKISKEKLMARPFLVGYPGAFYHIFSRGNNQQDISGISAAVKAKGSNLRGD